MLDTVFIIQLEWHLNCWMTINFKRLRPLLRFRPSTSPPVNFPPRATAPPSWRRPSSWASSLPSSCCWSWPTPCTWSSTWNTSSTTTNTSPTSTSLRTPSSRSAAAWKTPLRKIFFSVAKKITWCWQLALNFQLRKYIFLVFFCFFLFAH